MNQEESRVERNIYENPARAAEEANTHVAISVDSFSWICRGKQVKVRIVYRRGDYELRFAGALGTRVPDSTADRRALNELISRCRKWQGVNWL